MHKLKMIGLLGLSLAVLLGVYGCSGKQEELTIIEEEAQKSEDTPEVTEALPEVEIVEVTSEEIGSAKEAAEEPKEAAEESEEKAVEEESEEVTEEEESEPEEAAEAEETEPEEESEEAEAEEPSQAAAPAQAEPGSVTSISWNEGWLYADHSKIHTAAATLYGTSSAAPKGVTVAVNAGHGCSGGTSAKTLCHPDGSPKVTGGSTASGSTTATAINGGTTMLDGTPESSVTLALALAVKDELLANGYNVLMLRESSDAQLDNIARTVMANNNANCHIALHYDSTENDKGAFYIGVANVDSYRSMEPVASHYQQHEALGKALIGGIGQAGGKVWGSSMALDLTQTSYSTIPSVDMEVGDRASDHSAGTLQTLARGIRMGLDTYFP